MPISATLRRDREYEACAGAVASTPVPQRGRRAPCGGCKVIGFAACLAFFGAGLLSAQDSAATNTVAISVAFFFDDSRQPDIPVELSSSGALLSIDSAPLLSFLRNKAKEGVLASIRSHLTAANMISADDARKAGLDLTFDESSLALHVSVRPEAQQVHRVDLGAPSIPQSAVAARPADFSAELSVRSRLDLISRFIPEYAGVPSLSSVQFPFAASLEPAVNIRSFVLEGELTIDTSAAQEVALDALRLIKDVPGPDLRLMAGDLEYPVTGFESALPVLGIGVTRNFDLSPLRVYRPLGRMEFYLNHPSQVQVLVNGTVVRYLQLDPGPYSLADFPLIPGGNDLTVEIHDYMGRVVRLSSSVNYDSELLLPGESAFTWNVGLPGRTIAPPVLSGFQRLGVTPDLTMGAYAQADTANQMVGLEGTFATPIGTLNASAAGSYSPDYSFDWGAFGSFRFFSITRPNAPAFSVAGQYRGFRFLGPQSGTDHATYQWLLTGNIDQPLPRNLSLSLGLGYRIPWVGQPAITVSSIFTAPLGIGTSLSVNVGANYTTAQSTAWYGSVTVISSSAPGTTSININQSLTQPTSRVGVAYRPAGSTGLSFNADLIGPPAVPGQTSGASTELDFRGNRFQGSVGYSVLYDEYTSPAVLTNHPYLTFGTAFVFADGVAAITRPVDDSFVIFLRHPEISKERLGVNPIGRTYEAYSDRLGEAVLSDVQSYDHRIANVEVPLAPIGYDLGDTLFVLSLPYRSGSVIRVGTDATVYASGTLQSADGKPIALVAGSVSGSRSGGEPQQFFTDETGRFEIYGLRPGDYALTVANANWRVARLSIPPDASGLYDLGSVTLVPALATEKENPK